MHSRCHQPSQGKNRIAFTLIELLVVIAIIAILAAILFPVFARAREKARQITCASNEKQICLGVLQYTQDYDEGWPPRTITNNIYGGDLYQSWKWAVQPYIKSTQVWKCPDDPTSFPTPWNEGDWNSNNDIASTYAVVEQYHDANGQGEAGDTAMFSLGAAGPGTNYVITNAMTPEPANTIWLVESNILYNADGTCAFGTPCQDASTIEPRNNPYFWVGNRSQWLLNEGKNNTNDILSQYHTGGANFGYGDGHVKYQLLQNLIDPNNSENDAFIRNKAQGM